MPKKSPKGSWSSSRGMWKRPSTAKPSNFPKSSGGNGCAVTSLALAGGLAAMFSAALFGAAYGILEIFT